MYFLRSYNINKLAEQAVEEVLKIGTSLILQIWIQTVWTLVGFKCEPIIFQFVLLSHWICPLRKLSDGSQCSSQPWLDRKRSVPASVPSRPFVDISGSFCDAGVACVCACSHWRVQRVAGVHPRHQAPVLQHQGAHRQQGLLQQSAARLCKQVRGRSRAPN